MSLPEHARRALAALRCGSRERWGELDAPTIEFLDRNRLTPLFPSDDPHVERACRNTRLRLERLRGEYERIAGVLDDAGVEHVLLKGFSHGEEFLPDPSIRPSYDLDLLVPADQVRDAYSLLEELAFEAPPGRVRRHERADHLPPLVRRTGWEWRGDLYDPEIPAVVELHFRLWDPETEGFAAPGLAEFWGRRQGRELALVDRFGYAALHLLRHLFRGDLKLLHAYELACFLDRNPSAFEEWPHPPELRRLEAIASRLAADWFGPFVPAPMAREVAELPRSVLRWFERWGSAPIGAQFRPNKHELWLHWELLDGWPTRLRVARRRLFPAVIPGPIEGAFGAAANPLARSWRFTRHLASRAAVHAASLGRFAAAAVAQVPRPAASTFGRRPHVAAPSAGAGHEGDEDR